MKTPQDEWHSRRQATKGITEAVLRRAYGEEGKSLPTIAAECGTTRSSIQRLFRKFGIDCRSYKEAGSLHFGARDPVLSEQQTQLILGSLLGDACWGVGTMRYRDGSEHDTLKVHFYHTEKKLAYVEHKKQILGAGIRIRGQLKLSRRISGKGAVMRGFAFSATRTLKPLQQLTGYPKKVTRAWLDRLTWLGIAYWYQDDGSLCVPKGGKLGSIVLYTNGFSYGEHMVIRDWFQEVHGLHFKIAKSPNGTPDEWVLKAHRQADVYKFITNVRPHIVGCMQYKIRTWKKNFTPHKAVAKK